MNARFPVSRPSPWMHVGHHHILAAMGGAVMITAVVAGAIAWNARDTSSDSRSAGAASPGTFDRIEYSTNSAAVGSEPEFGLEQIRDLKATRSGTDVAIVVPGGDVPFDLYAGLDFGLAEIQGLKATRSATDVAIVTPGGDVPFDLYAGLDFGLAEIQDLKATRGSGVASVVSDAEAARLAEIALAIAEHDAAFPPLETKKEPDYPTSREGVRGPVTSE